MPPPFSSSSGGPPSYVEFFSPRGVLLPLVHSGITSALWLELRGPGDPLLGCVLPRLSSVHSMASRDVCHSPRCRLTGLGPAELRYCPCCWPGESDGSPQCVQPTGCGLSPPVPWLPWLCVCVQCPWPPGAHSEELVPCVLCAWCAVCAVSMPLGACSPLSMLCVLCVWYMCRLCPRRM